MSVYVDGDLESISAWPERRPPRTEGERSAIANRFASHLPKKTRAGVIGEEDILAMRAAFIRRFDEQLPRTETLMAVAHIGYRMALRDLALPHGETPITSEDRHE
jgi:hypothetical protein